MKHNDVKKLHDLSVSELTQKLTALTKEASLFKLQKMGHKLKDTQAVKKVRDDIARVKTILTVKEKVKA
jgi:ribosomal protein L29